MLLAIMVICNVTGPIVFAQSDTIVFEKTYNKDGKFYAPVTYLGLEGSEATVNATLTDANNNVIDIYTTMKAGPGTTITYSKSFAGLKSGTYYLNITCEFMFYDSITKSLKINHKAPAPKVAVSSVYQTYTDSGDVKHVFKLEHANDYGKIITIEVYDQSGEFLYSGSLKTIYNKGTCTFKWDYFPLSGGIMISSGTYILKYWVEGQTPKQQKFKVELGEG